VYGVQIKDFLVPFPYVHGKASNDDGNSIVTLAAKTLEIGTFLISYLFADSK
jgi:hypothetical protein